MSATIINLLGISGSLRQMSSNTTLLNAAQTLAPKNVTLTLYEGLSTLPHFNPDIEFDNLQTVQDLKAQVVAADGIILSCPEYAHGVPGSFKNGLDWLVGGPEFYDKPVVFFNASGRGTHAQTALREIVKTMSGQIIDDACLTLPFIGKQLDQELLETDPELSALIQAAIQKFATFLTNQQN